MEFLFQAYDVFINNFPSQYHWIISLGLLAIIVIGLFQLIRKSLLWLFLLILFVPAVIPILSEIGQSVLQFLQYIVSRV